MPYKPSDAYVKEFCTSSPSTGAAADADTTPVATANRNGTDDAGFVLTVTRIDLGRYKVTGTVPSGYVSGDVVNVSVAATLATVEGKACVDTFVVDPKRVGDLHDLGLTTVLASPRALDAVADNAMTLNDGLWCAVAVAAGKSDVNPGTLKYTIKTPSTGFQIRQFTIDSSTNPSSRT